MSTVKQSKTSHGGTGSMNYSQDANPNATDSELDAKVIIKHDGMEKDWEDFWYNSEDLMEHRGKVINLKRWRTLHNY